MSSPSKYSLTNRFQIVGMRDAFLEKSKQSLSDTEF